MGEVTQVKGVTIRKQSARVVSLKKGPQGEGLVGCSAEDKKADAEKYMKLVCFHDDQEYQNEFIKDWKDTYDTGMKTIIKSYMEQGKAKPGDCPNVLSPLAQDCPETTWCSKEGATRFTSEKEIQFQQAKSANEIHVTLTHAALGSVDGLVNGEWTWDASSGEIKIPFQHSDRLVFCKAENKELQTAWYGITIWRKDNNPPTFVCNEFIGADRPSNLDCEPKKIARPRAKSGTTAAPAADKPAAPATEKPAGNPFEM